MAISYCSNKDNIFSYTTGTGIPKGQCIYNGTQMSIAEAEQAGIDDGSRVEFRKTESFWMMLDHFYKMYGADKIYDYACREELDLEETLAKVIARSNK